MSAKFCFMQVLMRKMLKLQNVKKRKPKSFRRDWWSSWM